MRILYDGSIFGFQAAGGISRFYASVIHRLPSHWQPTLITPVADNANFPTHPRLRTFRWKRFQPTQISNLLERTYFRAVTTAVRPQILHPTYYTLLTRRMASTRHFRGRRRCPVVINVWDMIHETYPAMLDPNGYWAERKREAVLAADAIICISEHTRRDLLTRIPVEESKVSVIYLASELNDGMARDGENPVTGLYFLYVGSRSKYKNFAGLLEAFARVTRHRTDLQLAVVGAPFLPEENRCIAAAGLSERVQRLPVADDALLARLYRDALALIYPSFYEGFGIPPLEAMACGTTVIASNRSSLPEVVGDAGLSFDPTTADAADELAAHMLRLVDDPVERARLITRGQAQVAKFSWDRTASQTIEIYRSLAAL